LKIQLPSFYILTYFILKVKCFSYYFFWLVENVEGVCVGQDGAVRTPELARGQGQAGDGQGTGDRVGKNFFSFFQKSIDRAEKRVYNSITINQMN
jgi:hypothetical protein